MATNECNCNTGATDATVRRVYYKDDLDFYMTLLDCDDENIGVPAFDWRARLWTSSKMNYVTVSSVGGVKTNWRDEGDGRIHVVVDNPGLMPGDVHIDFEALLPNETFADGTRKLVKPFTAPIRLTKDCAPCPSAMEIELMLPYVRGKALTFDDLTDAEKDAFAQQAAGLVTIEDLGVASDEEVDEAMGELLDTPPTAEKKAFHLDRRIRRGIMPAKARPGIIYYDRGYVKLTLSRLDDNGNYISQSQWDITFLKNFIGTISIEGREHRPGMGGYTKIPKSQYEITEINGRVILTFPSVAADDVYTSTYWLRLDDDDTGHGGKLRDARGIMFIGSNGLLRRVSFTELGSGVDAVAEYAPDFSDNILPIFQEGFNNAVSASEIRGFDVRTWNCPHKKYRVNGKASRKFCKTTKYCYRIQGLFAVRIKSRKGYKSKWRKLYRTSKGHYLWLI